MRILLDECLPKKLKNDLKNHEVKTVPEEINRELKKGIIEINNEPFA